MLHAITVEESTLVLLKTCEIISYNGMKAESLTALALGNALCSQRASMLRPERAKAIIRRLLRK
jgi:hypothetical protein